MLPGLKELDVIKVAFSHPGLSDRDQSLEEATASFGEPSPPRSHVGAGKRHSSRSRSPSEVVSPSKTSAMPANCAISGERGKRQSLMDTQANVIAMHQN